MTDFALKTLSIDDPETLSKASKVLKKGGLIVAPTETAYGLLVDATNQKAVERVYSIKQRDKDKPLSIFLPDVVTAGFFGTFSERAQKIREKYLPGPLTIVVPARLGTGLAKGIIDAQGNVGLRVSGADFLQSLTRVAGVPLTATSANLTRQPSCYTLEALSDVIAEGADLLLEGDSLTSKGVDSTVVSVLGDTDQDIDVRREGAISEKDIRSI